jgi:hypothetical protein
MKILVTGATGKVGSSYFSLYKVWPFQFYKKKLLKSFDFKITYLFL